MKYFIPFLVLLVASCNISQKTVSIPVNEEKGEIIIYNEEKVDWPLVLVIPSVFNSQISQEKIDYLTRNKRVAVGLFLAHDNKNRVKQIDGVERRINYYSDVINNLSQENGDISLIISEGLNSLIVLRLLQNYDIPDAVFINSWFPSINQIIINTCYAKQSNTCDSLCNYLQLESFYNLNSLKADIDNGKTNFYGNFSTRMWMDIFKLSAQNDLENYSGEASWIYTANSGLINEELLNELQTKSRKRKKTYLISGKNFTGKKNMLSN